MFFTFQSSIGKIQGLRYEPSCAACANKLMWAASQPAVRFHVKRQAASLCLLLGGFTGRAASAAIWTLGPNKKIRDSRTPDLLPGPTFSNRSMPLSEGHRRLPEQRQSSTISQCCPPPQTHLATLRDGERKFK